MKNPRPSSNQLPAWHMERAQKLQRACERIRAAVASGEPLQKTIRRVARSLNGRPYRCDASRRLALSPKTLYRVWYAWRHGGEVPAVFKLNYFVRPSSVPASVMIRFVVYCAGIPQKSRSLAKAWLEFSKLGKPVKISLDQVYHYFPAAEFHQMQEQFEAIVTASFELDRLRHKNIASIKDRLPAPPVRLHKKNENCI
jgi:hypothetical protein